MVLNDSLVAEAAHLLVTQSPAVVLTGAGISVESGIPDFRSRGGLWERFDPMEYATIEAFQAEPEKVWLMLAELGRTLAGAEPNKAHYALAELESEGIVQAIITQNIDNLHQLAGSHRVIEFHGNGRRLVCLHCPRTLEELPLSDEEPPRCPTCGAIAKPDVVLFGEVIPEQAIEEAFLLSSQCRVMLVVGTSATVVPAATLPWAAKNAGAALIEINPERTELTGQADLVLRGPAATVLPALVRAVVSERAGQ
jgi:NAD-dependent deacetylase